MVKLLSKITISLLTVVLFYSNVSAKDLIGFRGANELFDQQAFEEFAQRCQLNPIVFSSTNVKGALVFINRVIQGEYELYGFSQGAAAVAQVLEYQQRTQSQMPQRVITVGAYHTTKVNFAKYGIPFKNYFDHSGRQNPGPGKLLDGVLHMQMQQRVNEIESWCY